MTLLADAAPEVFWLDDPSRPRRNLWVKALDKAGMGFDF